MKHLDNNKQHIRKNKNKSITAKSTKRKNTNMWLPKHFEANLINPVNTNEHVMGTKYKIRAVPIT